MSLTALRNQLRIKRRQLNLNKRKLANQHIVSRLIQHPFLGEAKKVAVYLPTDGEVDISAWILRAWQELKQCYLPITRGEDLLFGGYQSDTPLTPNQWGILEPKTDVLIPLNQMDAIILPLVGFDSQGNRLGRGGGYYDRALAFTQHIPSKRSPYRIGVGYSFQQVPSLQTHPWDIPMHVVITEDGTIISLL